MARRCCHDEEGSWVVKSISVKARDGPSRIERTYRILLKVNDPVIAQIAKGYCPTNSG